ncbi:helix-turn-helix transcriptional regulator [Chitinophaga eiseniae]|uniref:Helix-turn-helix transcriptional regulator n=1 Tax=Chitinophaga eiseniae TaxID=634771 RepID=A0A847SM43_9BACT|nr:AraC family transcriptional regulator [Chitinophaga eiseniae]NLR81244.1 helix-turn-helix transcriptional regulator [Chitinophaga eiseniae]
MGIVITDDANQVLLSEKTPFDFKKYRNQAIVEQTQEVRHPFGAANFQEFCFDGIAIAACTADVYENIHILSDFHEPRVMMLFMERGDITTTLDGFSNNFKFRSLEHNLMYSPCEAESAGVKKQRDMLFFGLSFLPEKFLQLAENNGRVLDGLANNIAGNRTTTLTDKFNPRITPRMQLIMEEVRQCRFQGGLKKLFLQSKALELLALQCEQIESAELRSVPARPKVSVSDVEKLHFAKDLLVQHLQQPLSLGDLARKSGLNEFKLKSGFKAVFDNTVFGYLNDRRLELARELIREGRLPLSAIALEAGYSSPQHFSSAFRKKFGISPSKIHQ